MYVSDVLFPALGWIDKGFLGPSLALSKVYIYPTLQMPLQ